MRWLVRWMIDGSPGGDMLMRSEDDAKAFAEVMGKLHPTDTVFIAKVGA